MEWRPAGWSVCLPLLIFPCTIKSRSSLLAPAHPGGPEKRAVNSCGGGGAQWKYIPVRIQYGSLEQLHTEKCHHKYYTVNSWICQVSYSLLLLHLGISAYNPSFLSTSSKSKKYVLWTIKRKATSWVNSSLRYRWYSKKCACKTLFQTSSYAVNSHNDIYINSKHVLRIFRIAEVTYSFQITHILPRTAQNFW